MNATRRPDAAAALATAAPARTCSAADRSRAGASTTTGSGGSWRPPMNHSGMSTPQSIGATAVDGSLDPKLTPTAGSPSVISVSSRRQASGASPGPASSTGLGALPPIVDPNVLTAASSRDDAAVYRIAPDRALVATVDFFTPIVDDPADFGAIAAANSISDVYAVGARPLFALNITAFPREKL